MAIGGVREAGPRSSADAAPGEPVDVTLITADEPLLGSVTQLLSGNRYRLSGRRQPQSLFSLLSEGRTDAVLLDLKLPIVQHLKWASLDGLNRKRAVPLVGICGVETERTTRLAALEDGLWDVVELPLEAAELIAKLDNWVWLKKDVDGLRAGVLLDVETGHYSSQGIKRRLREVSALAQRTGQALSCVLFGADPLPSGQELRTAALADAGRVFSLALHHRTRNSDVVGRLEPLKFMVLAPNTPAPGAVRLAERFTTLSLSSRVDGVTPITFSAGIAGIDGKNGQVQASPELLFAAANRALNQARAAGAAQVAVAWESV
jgi:PleD family two-component response regulator